MPESRIRRKSSYTPPPTRSPAKEGSAPWVAPLMVGLFVVGLLWLVVYYISQTRYPIPGVEWWNMLIGFGFIIAGFVVSTRWK